MRTSALRPDLTISFCTARAPYKHAPHVGDSNGRTRSLSLSALNCWRRGSIESLRTITGGGAWREELCSRFEAQPAPNRHVSSTIVAALENHGATTHSCSFRCSRDILRNLFPYGMQILFFITDSFKIKPKPCTRLQGQGRICEYPRCERQILLFPPQRYSSQMQAYSARLQPLHGCVSRLKRKFCGLVSAVCLNWRTRL